MAALHRSARSLMLLRLIGKNRDVQSSQLRALCQLLPPLSDYSVAADNQSRSYSCGSTTAPPLRNTEQCGLPGLADGTLNSAARRIQPHSAASQAAGYNVEVTSRDSTGVSNKKAISKNASSKEHSAKPKSAGQAFHDAGWTRQEVINIPNALSVGRLLSGPLVAHLIMQHQWPAALTTLAIAGISDWADGYAAKHWNQSSVLGSYLDPLADKVLVCCTVGALAAEGSLPVALAAIIIGRDVLLVTGACVDRCRRIGWRKVGWAEFFRTASSMPLTAGTASEAQTAQSQGVHSTDSSATAGSVRTKQDQSQSAHSASQEAGQKGESVNGTETASSEHSSFGEGYIVPPAEFVQPLYISKLNTVFQLCLIAGCISHSWYGWPTEDVLWGLGGITALATLGSFAAYVQVYRRGNMRTRI